MNKSTAAVILLSLSISHAYAQSNASATQQSTSQAASFGTLNMSQSPADQHLSETVRNVSAPVLGAYASSFSQMNCSSTTQGGFAIAGFSVAGGTSTESKSCVLEVAAAEMARQAFNDPENRQKLMNASIGVRCQVSEEVYNAMMDAGFVCKRKPKSDESRTDTQPESTRIAGN
ncbi:hypothetical protein [Caballeronia sp. LZ001]|uniref:hypothetical protein n=1 Tax=Caballeronia sp. LZ001 TaxID=3038553 RepID=UPI0028621F93|nr:hypothetical protein [Caballeronia sp. LZ001]MDR5802163.1 hypothetical protein [Caballeronia sp. LZ001]